MTEAAVPATAPAVLVVEDEALIALLLEDLLAGAGYRAVWSRDGQPAPSGGDAAVAAVVNLGLAGGLDGRDVIRRLRASRPGLPVAVVTGYGPEAPQADLRGLGGPTVRLAKPINGAELTAWLSAALGPAPSGAGPVLRRRRRSDSGSGRRPGGA